jgi:ribosomal protein S18 acetylase RimI-like enzyme
VSDVLVRIGREADLDAVIALWAAAGSEPTVTDDVGSLRRLLARDADALLVADGDGTIVGSLVAGFDGWRGSLYRLAVHPTWRRHGLGRALVRAGEARLAALGAARLDAIVVDTEDGALAFWAAVGYERQRERARFVRTLG